jgi:hypothetical protein
MKSSLAISHVRMDWDQKFRRLSLLPSSGLTSLLYQSMPTLWNRPQSPHSSQEWTSNFVLRTYGLSETFWIDPFSFSSKYTTLYNQIFSTSYTTMQKWYNINVSGNKQNCAAQTRERGGSALSRPASVTLREASRETGVTDLPRCSVLSDIGWIKLAGIVLGGLVVSVLVIRPKDRGFKYGQGRYI